jgi:thiol-disulfide isomerase/thioredoxin
MKRLLLFAVLVLIASPLAAQIVARPKSQPMASQRQSKAAADAAKFDAVIGAALQFLSKTESYVLTVDSQWKSTGDVTGQSGRSRYRLLARGKQHRIEVQSEGAKAPELVSVNDGQHMTTLLASRKLYSQHPVGSPQASLESNQLLAQALAGSAIDILLQPNVAQFVHAQATDLAYHGQERLDGKMCHRFSLVWTGAKVELWLAAVGDPLLVQFVRTASVPISEDACYEMIHTARFQWQLNAKLPASTFAISLPPGARRVTDIYDTLSGDDPQARIGQPLPEIELSQLDGSALEVAVPEGKRGLVLIFWASWCAPSVEEMPAVSTFVQAGQAQGVEFYAVNVGEAPGDVRRFIAKSPLTSAVVLDPKGQASSALRVTELPAAVVVGPDNTVHAILSGTAKQVQADAAKELAKLLLEPAAAPKTARRPGERPAQ